MCEPADELCVCLYFDFKHVNGWYCAFKIFGSILYCNPPCLSNAKKSYLLLKTTLPSDEANLWLTISWSSKEIITILIKMTKEKGFVFKAPTHRRSIRWRGGVAENGSQSSTHNYWMHVGIAFAFNLPNGFTCSNLQQLFRLDSTTTYIVPTGMRTDIGYWETPGKPRMHAAAAKLLHCNVIF